MAKKLEISVEDVENAQKIIDHLADLKPHSSFSFTLTEEGHEAVDETIKLTDWGIAKNKHKLKAAALEILEPLVERPPGSPLNVNLTEYEIKSMGEVADLIERSLRDERDGVLKK